MARDHPFQNLFETFGRMPSAHADAVNRRAYAELCSVLEAPLHHAGGCILLRAPRAGHGKTHLLSRMRHEFAATHECIQLHASRGYQIDPSTVLEDVVLHMLNDEPGMPLLSRMDVLARRMFALALQPLVQSGEVPCEDRDAALSALREDPLGTFDFGDSRAVTAQWTRETFDVLGERLAAVLARSCDLPSREIAFWVENLFRYTASSADAPKRHRALEDQVLVSGAGESAVMARLEALLGLLCQTRRVVLVADDLEGFSSDQGAALRLATLVVALRQSLPRLEVLISLNRDVWDGVFVPCLSDGLADRLSERLVELEALSEPEMVALLESRVPGMGAGVLARVDRDKAGTHSRGLIREAGKVWERAKAVGSGIADIQPESPVLDHARSTATTKNQAEAGFAEPAAMPTAMSSPAPEISDSEAFCAQPAPAKPVVELPVIKPESDAQASEPAMVAPTEAPVAGPSVQPQQPGVDAAQPEISGHQGEGGESLDPEDRARVDELLKQFRKRFGQDRF